MLEAVGASGAQPCRADPHLRLIQHHELSRQHGRTTYSIGLTMGSDGEDRNPLPSIGASRGRLGICCTPQTAILSLLGFVALVHAAAQPPKGSSKTILWCQALSFSEGSNWVVGGSAAADGHWTKLPQHVHWPQEVGETTCIPSHLHACYARRHCPTWYTDCACRHMQILPPFWSITAALHAGPPEIATHSNCSGSSCCP